MVTSIGAQSTGTTWRSWAKVKWDRGGTNDYRRGHSGYVDIKYVEDAVGEIYYVEHLPKLGKHSALLLCRWLLLPNI